MGTYEKGAVRIHYEEAGSGFPLLLIAGGGLNSNIDRITGSYPPFNAMAEFKDEYRRPDITMAQVDQFLTRMYRDNDDFVFTVTRDFVRDCQTPLLILPDDSHHHPYAVAMETAMLAPNAEASMFPWKEPKERVPLAVRQIRSFLRAHRPASV